MELLDQIYTKFDHYDQYLEYTQQEDHILSALYKIK